MCEKSGPQLPASAEVLFRQVPPFSCEEGEPTSLAFTPRKHNDDGCLSVDRSSLTSVEQSFALATKRPPDGFGLQSVGVWGLSLEDVYFCALTAWSDPVPASEGKPANPAHALIEFGSLSEGERRRLGRAFKVRAIARGRLFPSVEQASQPDVTQGAS